MVVDRVEASGVRAQLLRDAKGRRNIDDLAGRQRRPQHRPSAKPAADAGKPLRLRHRPHHSSTDLHARVKDELAGIDGELVLESLTTGRLANGVESPVELAAQLDFRKPRR